MHVPKAISVPSQISDGFDIATAFCGSSWILQLVRVASFLALEVLEVRRW
jgi:hypothetical protein